MLIIESKQFLIPGIKQSFFENETTSILGFINVLNNNFIIITVNNLSIPLSKITNYSFINKDVSYFYVNWMEFHLEDIGI